MVATINLTGPSETPGAPQITPNAVDAAVNAALAQTYADTDVAITTAIASVAPTLINVAQFFPSDRIPGTTDDTAAWLSAVALASTSPAGATITAPAGTVSLITGNITVNASGVRFDLPNVLILPSGSAITRCFDFEGTTTTGPVISADVAAFDNTITVSALNGVVAGSYVLFSRAAVVPAGLGDQYRLVAIIRSVSGSGPWVLQLNTGVPFSISAADSTIINSRLVPLQNCGVSGGVVIDGSGYTGAGPLHGIYHVNCVKSVIRDIKGFNISKGSVVFGFTGQHNIVENIEGVNCGSQNFAAIQLTGFSNSQCNHIRLEQSSGFGVVLSSWSYGTGTGFITQGSYGSGRGFKLQAGLFNNLSNFVSNFNHSNGVATAVASCYNTFSGISANSNIEFEGVWLSDQNNCFNTYYGINAFGNATRDLYIGATDLSNMFFGANIGVLEDHAPNTAFFTQGQPPNTSFPFINVDGTSQSTFGSDTLATGLVVNMDSAAGVTRTLRFETAGVERWTIVANATAETGANAGSDFIIGRWDDAGVSLGTVFTIIRSSGNATFASNLRINGLVGFNNTTPIAKPTVTGSKGANAALTSLLTALSNYGLITDSST